MECFTLGFGSGHFYTPETVLTPGFKLTVDISQVQISDELFFRGESCKPKKKTAKKDAAVKVLAKLKVGYIPSPTCFFISYSDIDKVQLGAQHLPFVYELRSFFRNCLIEIKINAS